MSIKEDLAASPNSDVAQATRDVVPRMYIHALGWRIDVKRGSDRAFCHVMAPDQNFYHRLVDGEIFLHRGEDRICLSCAARRGIIAAEPRRLRDDGPTFLTDSGEMPIYVPGVDD